MGVARQIVEHGSFKAEAPSLVTPPGLEGTLGWFKLLDVHLEDFVAGRMGAREIIAEGGGRLWETFQARDLVCAVFGHGVARALAPMLPGADVLELGTGTGGTTRRMAADLTTANRVVLSDLRQSFLDRVAAELPGVALETAIVDINQPQTGIGQFDLIFSTNCIHVAKDLPVTLGWIRRCLKPGGALGAGRGIALLAGRAVAGLARALAVRRLVGRPHLAAAAPAGIPAAGALVRRLRCGGLPEHVDGAVDRRPPHLRRRVLGLRLAALSPGRAVVDIPGHHTDLVDAVA